MPFGLGKTSPDADGFPFEAVLETVEPYRTVPTDVYCGCYSLAGVAGEMLGGIPPVGWFTKTVGFGEVG